MLTFLAANWGWLLLFVLFLGILTVGVLIREFKKIARIDNGKVMIIPIIGIHLLLSIVTGIVFLLSMIGVIADFINWVGK